MGWFSITNQGVIGMLSAILSFLGGSVFRMVWGEISTFIKHKQEHAQEMDRMRIQADLDQARHLRDMEMLVKQSELGIREIQVQGDIEVEKEDAEAFTEAMRSFGRPSGIGWVDAWNASVRPLFATACFALWILNVHQKGWVIDDFDKQLMAVIIGFFFADRTLKKHGR